MSWTAKGENTGGGYEPVLKENGLYDGDDYVKYYDKTWLQFQDDAFWNGIPFLHWYTWSIDGGA
ncbi:hypothetical protein BVX97_06380 [bacterium E08(2017)]|nr:hypothetical protein BVX97_06380 [bacterium E08(2017)]